jgi:hypothetical protein
MCAFPGRVCRDSPGYSKAASATAGDGTHTASDLMTSVEPTGRQDFPGRTWAFLKPVSQRRRTTERVLVEETLQ